MTTTQLEKNLCKDFVNHIAEMDGESFIVTNFHYPDGDFVIFYLDGQARILEDFRITDKGITLFKCRESGIEITESRRIFVENVCGDFDVELKDGILSKSIRETDIGIDVLEFCEAISRISTLEYEGATRYDTSHRYRTDFIDCWKNG